MVNTLSDGQYIIFIQESQKALRKYIDKRAMFVFLLSARNDLWKNQLWDMSFYFILQTSAAQISQLS